MIRALDGDDCMKLEAEYETEVFINQADQISIRQPSPLALEHECARCGRPDAEVVSLSATQAKLVGRELLRLVAALEGDHE